MSEERTNNLLSATAELSRTVAFEPDYRASITDEDALGVAISKWLKWDGDKIAEVFFSALEDANYHAERRNFIYLWNDWNGTKFR